MNVKHSGRALASLLLILAASLGLGALESPPVLVLNTQDFAPFTYMVDGKPSGPGVEIVTLVCREAGIELTVQLLPWTRAQEEVAAGLAHGLFMIGWNADREAKLHASPPVFATEYGVFVRSDDALAYSSPLQLKGRAIACYGPSNTSKSLEAIKAQEPSIVIDITPDDESAFKKLSLGRADAAFSNRDVGMALIAKLKLANLRYAGASSKLLYYIGFSKDTVPKELVDRFGAAYRALYAKGTLQELAKRYSLEMAKPGN